MLARREVETTRGVERDDDLVSGALEELRRERTVSRRVLDDEDARHQLRAAAADAARSNARKRGSFRTGLVRCASASDGASAASTTDRTTTGMSRVSGSVR